MSGRGARLPWIRGLFAIAAALLAFTWAERTPRAETFTPPPMEFHPKPDSKVWVLGSLDFIGFGGRRLGAIFAAYGGEAHVWLTPNLGIGARASAYAAGEPDGGGSSGTLLGGSLSARAKVVERTHQTAWLWGSLGVGSVGLAGHDSTFDRQPFHERAAYLCGRFGVVGEYGPLAYGAALELIVAPRQGLAGSPVFFGGFDF